MCGITSDLALLLFLCKLGGCKIFKEVSNTDACHLYTETGWISMRSFLALQRNRSPHQHSMKMQQWKKLEKECRNHHP